ncbi:hypothetical protein ACC754_37870, partial [Rhizobium johnstonii]
KHVRARDTTRRIRRGLALIPEDRQLEGLVQVLSIASNLTLSSLGRFTRLFHIDRGAEKISIRDAIRDLSIKAPTSMPRLGSSIRSTFGLVINAL